jgi:hypothetical protein
MRPLDGTEQNIAGQTKWPGVKYKYRHCPISMPVFDALKSRPFG